MWLCRVIHIYLCLSEINPSKGFFWCYRAMVLEQYINGAWYYLGIPYNFSHKLKLILPQRKMLPNLKLPCYLRGAETFLRTAIKMEIPLTHLYFLFLIFFQYGLCTKCSHFCAWVTRVFTTVVPWEWILSLAVWKTRQTD